MTLEAAKELDRRCVWNWLNDVWRNPTVAFNTYSDDQLIEFAHDALVLLKEQEPVEPNVIIDTLVCGNCGTRLERQSMVGDNILVAERFEYCPRCGRKVKWND